MTDKFNYRVNQIEKLTDGGAYGYSIQINCNANGDRTTWMNITDDELQAIKALFQDDISRMCPVCGRREDSILQVFCPECGDVLPVE